MSLGSSRTLLDRSHVNRIYVNRDGGASNVRIPSKLSKTKLTEEKVYQFLTPKSTDQNDSDISMKSYPTLVDDEE